MAALVATTDAAALGVAAQRAGIQRLRKSLLTRRSSGGALEEAIRQARLRLTALCAHTAALALERQAGLAQLRAWEGDWASEAAEAAAALATLKASEAAALCASQAALLQQLQPDSSSSEGEGEGEGPGSGDLTEEQEALARSDILRMDACILAEEAASAALHTRTEEVRGVLAALCARGGHATLAALVAAVQAEAQESAYTVASCAFLQAALADEGERARVRGLALAAEQAGALAAAALAGAARGGLAAQLAACRAELGRVRESVGGAGQAAVAAVGGAVAGLALALGLPVSSSASSSSSSSSSQRGGLGRLLLALQGCEHSAGGLAVQAAELLCQPEAQRACLGFLSQLSASASASASGGDRQRVRALAVAREAVEGLRGEGARLLLQAVTHQPPSCLSASLTARGSGSGSQQQHVQQQQQQQRAVDAAASTVSVLSAAGSSLSSSASTEARSPGIRLPYWPSTCPLPLMLPSTLHTERGGDAAAAAGVPVRAAAAASGFSLLALQEEVVEEEEEEGKEEEGGWMEGEAVQQQSVSAAAAAAAGACEEWDFLSAEFSLFGEEGGGGGGGAAGSSTARAPPSAALKKSSRRLAAAGERVVASSSSSSSSSSRQLGERGGSPASAVSAGSRGRLSVSSSLGPSTTSWAVCRARPLVVTALDASIWEAMARREAAAAAAVAGLAGGR